ncbi:MAG: TolC family protein [Endomicrobiales bacterium]|nr:TolC family protein [Endomicrobiales bacterium]
MKIFRIALLACVLITCPAKVFSSSDQFLDTCLQIAQARDKKLAVADEQLGLAQRRVFRAGRMFFPYIMAQRRFTRGKTVFKSAQNEQVYESEEIGLRASQPVFMGGRLTSTYRYEKLMEEAARYNYTKIKEDLFYNIKLSYYEYLSLKMEFFALSRAFSDIEYLAKKVLVEYNAKAISELDLVEAQNFRDKVENLYRASERNLRLAEKKLSALVNVDSLDDVPVPVPQGLNEDIPEISFSLSECLGFVPINSVDLKLNQLQIKMAGEKRKAARSKTIPKISVDGFYGKSGEAFVTEPLTLATAWSIMGRLQWTLWGNSFEAANSQEKMNPNEIVEPTARTDTNSLDFKLAILDDVDYFIETRESRIGYQQAQSEYDDMFKKITISFEKSYNEYVNSLKNERTLKNEIALKQRKLALLKKRNELFEVPTVQVMEEAWKYAETISAFARALNANYASVSEMERLVLIPLR